MTGDDPKAGRAVFRSANGPNCINCHQISKTEGKEIGPPLNNIGGKPKEALALRIDPGAERGDSARTKLRGLDDPKTKDGRRLTGIKVEDNDEKVSLKTMEGEFIEIPAERRREEDQGKKSLMPEKLIETMTTKDLVDLVEYLTTQKVNP